MKDIKKFTITIDRRQEHKGSETLYTDLRVWLRMEAPEDSPGLRWISFLLMGDEAQRLFSREVGHLSDGYHQLTCFGELWTFFDIDRLYQRDSAGEASIPYRRVILPIRVQDHILADLQVAVRSYDDSENKQEIVLDYSADLQSWSEQFGRGSGQLVIEGPEDEIEALKGEASFDRSWETIARIAINTTHSREEKGIVKIYRESDSGFLWRAGGLHGGLINHGTAEAPDWSVHT